jgi:hypothetical protein
MTTNCTIHSEHINKFGKMLSSVVKHGGTCDNQYALKVKCLYSHLVILSVVFLRYLKIKCSAKYTVLRMNPSVLSSLVEGHFCNLYYSLHASFSSLTFQLAPAVRGACVLRGSWQYNVKAEQTGVKKHCCCNYLTDFFSSGFFRK